MGNHSAQQGSRCPVLGRQQERVLFFTRSRKEALEGAGAKVSPPWGLFCPRYLTRFETAVCSRPLLSSGMLEGTLGIRLPTPYCRPASGGVPTVSSPSRADLTEPALALNWASHEICPEELPPHPLLRVILGESQNVHETYVPIFKCG